MEGFPWDDLRKILPECQRVANGPNGVETLPKIYLNRLSTVHERCIRQTDDRLTEDDYSER